MNKRIDEIRERCDAATPGPWKYKTNRHPNTNGTPWGWIEGPAGNMCWSGNQSKIDAEFIAHSREDIPYLLGEIESLQAQLTKKTELLNATVAGQETLQKALAASQRREQAAIKDIRQACENCLHSGKSSCPWEGTYHHRGEHGEKIGVCNAWQWHEPQEKGETE